MTTFHQVNVGLSNGQIRKLKSAMDSGQALPVAAKALGLAGLSFGAEKALKKIFGSGIPPGAVELWLKNFLLLKRKE